MRAGGRAAILATFALFAACVPTEPEKEVRGGIALTPAPSEATAGRPFQSPDGWTVTLEKTALRVYAYAVVRQVNDTYYGSGQGSPRIIDPRYACEVRVTGLAPGPAALTVQLQPTNPDYVQELAEYEHCAVDDEVLRRFKTYADDTLYLSQCVGCFRSGPSLYVKGSATKGGQRIRFELGLSVDTFLGPTSKSGDEVDGTLVDVVANQGTPARFEVHFEQMFADGLDAMAAADADGDGDVTAEELRAVNLECDTTNPYPSGDDDDATSETTCRNLVDQLGTLASSVVSLGANP